MTSDAFTLVEANIVVCMVAAISWLTVGSALRLASAVAHRFVLCNLLVALGLFLTLYRGVWAVDWLVYPLADTLGLAGLAMLAAGVRLFVHRQSFRHGLMVCWLGGSLLLWLRPYETDGIYHALVYSLVAACLLLQASRDALVVRHSRSVLWATRLVVSPLVAVALLFCLRAAIIALGGGMSPQVAADDLFNIIFLLLALALNLAVNISLAGVVVLRLVDRLYHLSITDSMTGALNRRAFARELAASQRQFAECGQPYTVCLLDIDHFKQINDQLGHAAGDAAIRHLVQRLRLGLRESDRLGRLGGEEFAILLAETTLAGASQVAHRLQADLASHPFRWGGQSHVLTASFGVAGAQREDEGAMTLQQRADEALYRAKMAGRNRVELA